MSESGQEIHYATARMLRSIGLTVSAETADHAVVAYRQSMSVDDNGVLTLTYAIVPDVSKLAIDIIRGVNGEES